MTNYESQRYTVNSNLGEMKCNIVEINDVKAKAAFKEWLSKKCNGLIKRDERFGTKITSCSLKDYQGVDVMTVEISLDSNGRPIWHITEEA